MTLVPNLRLGHTGRSILTDQPLRVCLSFAKRYLVHLDMRLGLHDKTQMTHIMWVYNCRFFKLHLCDLFNMQSLEQMYFSCRSTSLCFIEWRSFVASALHLPWKTWFIKLKALLAHCSYSALLFLCVRVCTMFLLCRICHPHTNTSLLPLTSLTSLSCQLMCFFYSYGSLYLPFTPEWQPLFLMHHMHSIHCRLSACFFFQGPNLLHQAIHCAPECNFYRWSGFSGGPAFFSQPWSIWN